MLTGQDVIHLRGDDLAIPVTVSLDQSRSLDGGETWKWVLRKTVEGAALVTKVSSAQITHAGPSFQPIVVLLAADFLAANFPNSIDPQHYIHELEMTKDGLVETVLRGRFTVLSDVVAV